MKYDNTVTLLGETLDVVPLQVLYRERYLKISQAEFCTLTGIKQPNLSAHESPSSPAFYSSICAAYETLGFYRWLLYAATSIDELATIKELIDPDSTSLYITQEYYDRLIDIRNKCK